MKKILFISDPHLPYEKNDLQSNPDLLKTRDESGDGINQSERDLLSVLDKSMKYTPFDVIIYLGDILQGYEEQGLVKKACKYGAKEIKFINKKYFKGVPVKYIAGDHEIGYILSLSADPNGGPSLKSLKNFQTHFNEAFYSFIIDGFKFIALSSDLEFADKINLELHKIKLEQRQFLTKELESVKSNQKIILLIHDPDALAALYSIIKPYKRKISFTLAGHFHAPWIKLSYSVLTKLAKYKMLHRPLLHLFAWKYSSEQANKILKYITQNTRNPEIWKRLNLQIVPSTGGVNNYGSGGVILELQDDKCKLIRF